MIVNARVVFYSQDLDSYLLTVPNSELLNTLAYNLDICADQNNCYSCAVQKDCLALWKHLVSISLDRRIKSRDAQDFIRNFVKLRKSTIDTYYYG